MILSYPLFWHSVSILIFTFYTTMQFDVATFKHKLAWQEHFGSTFPPYDFDIPARLWEEWGRQGGRPVFVLLCGCVSTLPFFRNAPWVLFVNHPATDTSLCLHLFTASGNVAPRLFWRGLPDWLTNEEPDTFYGPAVFHITGPDNSPSLSPPPEKNRGF